MKISKTILWTSLFWIFVICGLWIASLFFPQEATIVIPQKVKSVIIEEADIKLHLENWDSEPVKMIEPTTEETLVNDEITTGNTMEEEIAPENEATQEEQNEETIEEAVIEEVVAEPVSNSIIPGPTTANTPAPTSNEEIIALQNRVTEIEGKYNALVEELRTIFATPVFAQLLNQAFAEVQNTETVN